MTRVFISPRATDIPNHNGVGQVVHAQYQHLNKFDIELVDSAQEAEVVAAHITGEGLPRVDVLHCHGLLWTGDPETGNWGAWADEVNRQIVRTARAAYAVTVPSEWVAMPFKRDMRLTPVVIGHGVDADGWSVADDSALRNYVIWNKNRVDGVCDPTPAWELAKREVEVMSTFLPAGKPHIPFFTVTGPMPHAKMKHLIHFAGAYLATTRETGWIGVLEALACGVPILGYCWGATADLIEHKRTGYLVEPGDVDGLMEGLDWIRANREEAARACRALAERYDWTRQMGHYADLYRSVAQERKNERYGVSVIIPCYNYAKFLPSAVESVMAQSLPAAEVIIVDDGSTDDTPQVAAALAKQHKSVRVIRQANQGLAGTRTTGVQAATQPLITILDADDRLHKEYLKALVPAFQDRALGMAYTGLGLLQVDGSVRDNVGWPWPFDADCFEKMATPHVPPTTCIPVAAMFRRAMWEAIGTWQQCYVAGEDAEFWLRGLAAGWLAQRVTAAPLFEYRNHDSYSKKWQWKDVSTWKPWMRDADYPMAAPAAQQPAVRSYERPLVSVIVPVGPGHAQYLPGALESLLGQTLREWEVIIVNDSGKRLDLTPYPFVRVIQTKGKVGTGKARNLGATAARAALVVYLDADDWLLPTALAAMLAAHAETDGARYIYTDWLDDTGTRHECKEYQQTDWRGQHAVTALVPTAWAREVGGFDETMPAWEDWDFYLKLATAGYCGQRLAEPLLVYRLGSGQRRLAATLQKKELLAMLKERYAPAFTGGRMSCCGGSGGEVVLRAKQVMGLQMEMGQVQEVQMARGDDVRMQYMGKQAGGVLFTGKKSGRLYKGANNPLHRFANVDPGDVADLEATGKWERVKKPSARGAPATELAPEAVTATPPASPVGAAGEPKADAPKAKTGAKQPERVTA